MPGNATPPAPLSRRTLDLFRLGNPMEWSSTAKGMLVGVVTLLLFAQYLVWSTLVLCCAPDVHWVDRAYLSSHLGQFYGFAILSMALIVVFPLLRRFIGDTKYYEYAACLYFGLSLSFFSYQVGTLTLPVGVVLSGAPLVGFIFFNQGAVIVALCATLVVQLVLTFGASEGWWMYAPLLDRSHANGVGMLDIIWGLDLYVLTLPHLLMLIVIAYLVLSRWRDREERTRIQSNTDALTGLFNRRSILAYLALEQARSVRDVRRRRARNRQVANRQAGRHDSHPVSVLMVDLDHFKGINDNHGHEAGDLALIAAAKALQKNLRQNDRVGRYGGEEFLVVLPKTDREEATMVAERCRAQLEVTEVAVPNGAPIRLSGSVGVSCNVSDNRMSVDEMLYRADKAMYRAKQSGRNRVVVDDAGTIVRQGRRETVPEA